MTSIRNLSYMGFGASDPDAWQVFASEILGLAVAEPPPGADEGSVYFRMDDRTHRLVAEPGRDGEVHYLGFEVATSSDLQHVVGRLRSGGIEVRPGSAEECARRRVVEMAVTADPGGTRVELAVGQERARRPFVSPTGASFVTGEMGLGHVLFTVPDAKQFVAFYLESLDFAISDTVSLAAGIEGYFLHCNPRHHTVAAIEIPDQPARLGHLMVEVDDIDVMGIAYDNAIKRSIPIPGTLGKHTNDQMLSFYCTSPAGFDVEYGVGGRRVDVANWVAGHYTAASFWGHARFSDPRP